jgi:cell fate (sporulation/competence/biofilm development) regulator YlbF (YheA/YmcA/DUF963 family)
VNEEIMELAEKLGKAIAASPQAAGLRAARAELLKHPEVQQLLKDYQAQAGKLAKLQDESKPIEPEDKRKLEELQNKLVSDETFKKYTAAQVEYVDVMRKVNSSLQKPLAEVEAPPR